MGSIKRLAYDFMLLIFVILLSINNDVVLRSLAVFLGYWAGVKAAASLWLKQPPTCTSIPKVNLSLLVLITMRITCSHALLLPV